LSGVLRRKHQTSVPTRDRYTIRITRYCVCSVRNGCSLTRCSLGEDDYVTATFCLRYPFCHPSLSRLGMLSLFDVSLVRTELCAAKCSHPPQAARRLLRRRDYYVLHDNCRGRSNRARVFVSLIVLVRVEETKALLAQCAFVWPQKSLSISFQRVAVVSLHFLPLLFVYQSSTFTRVGVYTSYYCAHKNGSNRIFIEKIVAFGLGFVSVRCLRLVFREWRS
jgi:hypothetical protein